ncbi:lytic murein transglycosylase [Aquabacterium sp.]|uniref:lytic murein transglycosylase n=1 Tax=Aquabacterium sp. TaxID=1872578 RepID=UPI002487CEE9|nr:lytic murein transglycosylase [Aquabacterium sp.]MDI1257756.1 lytic murein transglycosylase [Aquabacterium sp.]
MPLPSLHLRSALLALAVLSGCASGPATQAPTDVPIEQRFAQWVANYRETARAAGIDEATLHSALDGVQLRHRAVEADRAQPEFTRTVWDYLDAVITPQRVATGQQKQLDLRLEAEAATARHGVPGPILMAVWGIESNYGGNYGDVPVIDALATLGFEGRRETWARGELLSALKILQQGDIDRARMIGSWAGAMGQTQFMPSSYLAYAVDADGDGRRDIWGSMADVLASTANYLAKSGWRADEGWGLEVQLPAGFDPARADPAVLQSSAQWAAEGVRSMGDAPWPSLADAAILMPAGARGPAFMVGRNYRTILRYNNSASYALTVCLLAQRIGGGPGVQAPWPLDLRALTRGEMLALQAALNRRGFDSGPPDGQMGPATRKALRAFQSSVGWPADGHPTAELLQRLQQDQ